MSDLLNSASLVMIPSGYKEDVVYSQIPTDGSGDLSFTRASNGTRINSAGLVEVCPWNLLSDSNTFTAGWAIGIGGGSLGSLVADPFGGTTAQVLNLNNNGILYNSSVSPYPTTISTTSIWMRTQSGSVSIQLGNPVGSPYFTKTITTTWTRFDIQVDPSSFNGGIALYNSVHGSAITIEIFGAQVNIGSTAKPYFPTTDRLNVPRLTYQNGGGGCPSLLLEKQSTNLFYPSDDFTDANWVASNLTITANDATSPDGTQNAEKFVTTSTTFENQVRYGSFSILGNVGSSYTVSIYAKKGTADFLRIRNLFVQDGATGGNAWFNLSTGAVGTVQASQTASMQNMGNGWYRCILTGIVGSSNNYNFVDIGFTNTDATNYPSTSVNGYVWGAQLEASSYATSYIGTTSSSATRVADACYKTGISSLIGQTEGVIFWDGVINGYSVYSELIPISLFASGATTTGAQMYIRFAGTGTINFLLYNGSSIVFNIVTSAIYTVGSRIKVAGAYKNNDFVFYVNGTQIGASTSGSVVAMADLYFDYQPSSGYLGQHTTNEAILFSTRLTNAELQAITTI